MFEAAVSTTVFRFAFLTIGKHMSPAGRRSRKELASLCPFKLMFAFLPLGSRCVFSAALVVVLSLSLYAWLIGLGGTHYVGGQIGL